MTQRYCESCGNLFDAKSTAGVTPPGKYLCPNCATKKASEEGESEAPGGSVMDKGAGLKKSVEGGDAGEKQEDVKLTFRCPGCNALLSSRKIDKRSRLTCPKCNEKVILNPDGTSELLSKPSPHMKNMEIPDKKSFTDQDLERLLDFGETQPITKDSGQAAPTPRPPSGRKKAAPAPPAESPASAEDEYEKEQEKLRFLDQVQGPGRKAPAASPKTLDSEIPSRPKPKGPPSRKKLTRFGTDRQKSDSVEDRLEAAKRKRAAVRNNILAVVFIVLPVIIGVVAFYTASKKPEEGKEPSGFGKLVKDMGARIKPGLLAIGKDILKQEPAKPEEKPAEPEQKPEEEQGEEAGTPGGDEESVPEQPGETPEEPTETPEKPAETPQEPAEVPDKPAETPEKPAETPEEPVETPDKPAETPDKPAETPEEPAETPDKPAETPEKPAETPDKPAETPDKPAETPEKPAETPEKPAEAPEKAEFKFCPKCGKPAKKDALKCPWCPYEYPPPKKEEEPKKEEPKKEEGAKTH
jgi:DNA-directed RNA polymerase subunit M/transcription elongation factor TFIIS